MHTLASALVEVLVNALENTLAKSCCENTREYSCESAGLVDTLANALRASRGALPSYPETPYQPTAGLIGI